MPSVSFPGVESEMLHENSLGVQNFIYILLSEIYLCEHVNDVILVAVAVARLRGLSAVERISMWPQLLPVSVAIAYRL